MTASGARPSIWRVPHLSLPSVSRILTHLGTIPIPRYDWGQNVLPTISAVDIALAQGAALEIAEARGLPSTFAVLIGPEP